VSSVILNEIFTVGLKRLWTGYGVADTHIPSVIGARGDACDRVKYSLSVQLVEGVADVEADNCGLICSCCSSLQVVKQGGDVFGQLWSTVW
jgi:hypothetical protein